MFRFKRSIPLDYNAQGYIYFQSLRYRGLPERSEGWGFLQVYNCIISW